MRPKVDHTLITMSIKLVRKLKAAEQKYNENRSPANEQELRELKDMLTDSKAKIKVNKLKRRQSSRTERNLKTETFRRAVTNARNEIEKKKLKVDKAAREHEAARRIVNEDRVRHQTD